MKRCLAILTSCMAFLPVAFGADATRMKVLTYNIAGARGVDGVYDPSRTASRIAAEAPEDPDIPYFACLNETSPAISQDLANRTGLHCTSADNSNAILSRTVPVYSCVTNLPYVHYGNRNVFFCDYGEYVLAVTHFDLHSDAAQARLDSVEIIRTMAETFQKPLILTGDLNDKPGSSTLKAIRQYMTVVSPLAGKTYHDKVDSEGNIQPGYIIDYVIWDTAHTNNFVLLDSHIVEDRVTSDHAPVTAEFWFIPSDLGWINEKALTTGRTGSWSPTVKYAAGTERIDLNGENTFTPSVSSEGDIVSIDVTAALDIMPPENDGKPIDAQAAVCIRQNGSFAVWTAEGWIGVSASGVVPSSETEYVMRIKIDYSKRMYAVSVLDGAEWKRFATAGGKNAFSIGTSGTAVSHVVFMGDGSFKSLFGEFVKKIKGFYLHFR